MKHVFMALFLVFLCFLSFRNREKSTFIFQTTTFKDSVITKEPIQKKKSLTLKGKYCCLVDGNSGRILYSKNANEKAPMASTTKIMTCLLALESNRLTEYVTVSKKAASQPKVHLGMLPNERYRLKDLLYSLMLTSHNDTAVAIAEHLGGSVEGFAKMMNQRAKKMGLRKTSFVTPNGLDSENHYTTAYELCVMSMYAKGNNLFNEITSTPSYHFTEEKGKRAFTVSNKDLFLSIYEGATGVKTGFTSKAGYCFAGAASRKDISLLSSTLACGWPPSKNDKWRDTKTLMDFGFDNYSYHTLPVKKISSHLLSVGNTLGEKITLVDIDPPRVLLSPSDQVKVKYHFISKLEAPISTKKPIGYVTYFVNNDKITSLGIYSNRNVSPLSTNKAFCYILKQWLL